MKAKSIMSMLDDSTTIREQQNAAPRIADIPKYRDMTLQLAIAKKIAKWVPRVAPIGRLLGVEMKQVVEAARQIEELVPEIEGHVELPDRFNALYAGRGWIAYSSLGHQVMVDAIAAGDRGELEAGEELLMVHYTPDILNFQVARLGCLENFQDRRELARLTRIDFFEGRYHACIPNLLMMIDGLASDVAQHNESFFSEKADLTAWNSVVGHPSALSVLASVMTEPRMKRRTEQLRIPHRHGILHGRDLGFGNRLVAAKCWAALFAVGEWAAIVERRETLPLPPQPRRGLFESIREMSRQRRNVEQWKNWRPRVVDIGQDIPRSEQLEVYKEGTAERLLIEFLTLWRRRNFGDMAKLVTIGRNRVDPRTRAGEINRAYRESKLEVFELQTLRERSPNVTDIGVLCTIEGRGRVELSFLVVREDDTGDWHTDFGVGTWRIQNWDLVAHDTRGSM